MNEKLETACAARIPMKNGNRPQMRASVTIPEEVWNNLDVQTQEKIRMDTAAFTRTVLLRIIPVHATAVWMDKERDKLTKPVEKEQK